MAASSATRSTRWTFPIWPASTALNIALIRELASAPPAPASAVLGGALSSDTRVSWAEVPGAARYKVYWRRADARDWEQSQETTDTKLTLPGVIVDDHFAGVAAVAENGAESAITFAGLPPRQ
jgi:hypothetical protein